jgi:hypothetical protein
MMVLEQFIRQRLSHVARFVPLFAQPLTFIDGTKQLAS